MQYNWIPISVQIVRYVFWHCLVNHKNQQNRLPWAAHCTTIVVLVLTHTYRVYGRLRYQLVHFFFIFNRPVANLSAHFHIPSYRLGRFALALYWRHLIARAKANGGARDHRAPFAPNTDSPRVLGHPCGHFLLSVFVVCCHLEGKIFRKVCGKLQTWKHRIRKRERGREIDREIRLFIYGLRYTDPLSAYALFLLLIL